MVLALDLVGGVAEGGQEGLIGVADGAIHVELDDRLRLVDGVQLAGDVGRLELLRGDVRRVVDDLERLAVEVQDGVVGGLDPHLLAPLADPLELARLELTSIELGPELFVFGSRLVARFDEHAVMPALDLI